MVGLMSGKKPEATLPAVPHIFAVTSQGCIMRVSNNGDWQLRQCPDANCTAGTLRVRRDHRNRELWWAGRIDSSGTWSIAATEPCCPVCGSDLKAELGERERAG
jgi:hypothetical protein